MGKTLEEAGHMDYEGAGFLRWVAGYGTSAFVWHAKKAHARPGSSLV